MTREETKRIIRIISNAYPNWHPENLVDLVDTWTMMLSEYEYTAIALALKTFILSDRGGFAPSIGQLVNVIHEVGAADAVLNENEAWELVYKAICNSTYHAREEYERLPVIVQKAVGSYQNLSSMGRESDFNISVESSNFKRVYRTVVERERKIAAIPKEVRKGIAEMQRTAIGTKLT